MISSIKNFSLPSNEQILWNKIPSELFPSIFYYLKIEEILAVSLVNKKFNLLANEPSLWDLLVKRDWGSLTQEEERICKQEGSKAFYIRLASKTMNLFISKLKYGSEVVIDKWNQRFLINLTNYQVKFEGKASKEGMVNSTLKINGMDLVSGLGSHDDEIPFYFRGFILTEGENGLNSFHFTAISMNNESSLYPLQLRQTKKETLYVWEPGLSQNYLLPIDCFRIKQVGKPFPILDLTVAGVVSCQFSIKTKIEIHLFIQNKRVVFTGKDCFNCRPHKLKVTIQEGKGPHTFAITEHDANCKIEWQAEWDSSNDYYVAKCLTN